MHSVLSGSAHNVTLQHGLDYPKLEYHQTNILNKQTTL